MITKSTIQCLFIDTMDKYLNSETTILRPYLGPNKTAVLLRWYNYHNTEEILKIGPKKVVFIMRWSYYGGGPLVRFYYTSYLFIKVIDSLPLLV